MNRNLRFTAQAAVIAALYVALTYLQELLLPSTTSAAVQFRVSEVLTFLACFTPAAIPGLTIGCMLANVVSINFLPLDMVVGSCATLFAVLCMYFLRNIKIKSFPFAAAFMPAIFNGLIIGAEIEIFFVEEPFNIVHMLAQGGLVALGELVVCFVLGPILCTVIDKTPAVGKLLYIGKKDNTAEERVPAE